MATDGLKHIRLRWATTCASCGRELGKGAWAFHDAASRRVRCLACGRAEGRAAAGISSQGAAPEGAEGRAA